MVAALIAGALTASVQLQAQTTARIHARVVDADAQSPVVGAQVRVLGSSHIARSDTSGLAVLTSILPGDIRLEVKRLGYEPVIADLILAAADTLELEVALLRVTAHVDTVKVLADAVRPGLAGFDARRERGYGQFIEPDAIAAEGSREIGDVLAGRLRGVRVVTGTDGVSRYIVSSQPKTVGALSGGRSDAGRRGIQDRIPSGACVMHVYVDGVFLTDPDVSFVETRSLAAVEVYTPANMPPQFRRAGSDCGVLVMWSRLGPRD